jgi:hypothetical protein
MSEIPERAVAHSAGKIVSHPKRQEGIGRLVEDEVQRYAFVCHTSRRIVNDTLQQLSVLEGRVSDDLHLQLRAECRSILTTLDRFERYAGNLDATQLPSSKEIALTMARVQGLGLQLAERIRSRTANS